MGRYRHFATTTGDDVKARAQTENYGVDGSTQRFRPDLPIRLSPAES